MLKLGLGLSLSSIRPQGAWSPDDESSLEAWYQNKVGITLNGSDVSDWEDSSSNSHTMEQNTATEQPAYSAGVLTFDSGDTNNLQSSSTVSLSGAFTIGYKANPTAFNNVILGDNVLSNEMIKYVTSSRLAIKIDGTTKNLNLDSGTFGDDYVLLTRDGSNVITLYKNGVAQSVTQTLAGTADINSIGVRDGDKNPFDGTVEEVQIYSSSSSALTANVNSRLAGI
jgi:hypothetical protein